VLRDEDWDQLQNLAVFVADIDFANQAFKPLPANASGTDLYVMGTSTEAFAWGRSFAKEDLSGAEFRIGGLEDGDYTIRWYNTWEGEFMKTGSGTSRNGELILKVPHFKQALPDVACKIRQEEMLLE
jgi:hypothetical protein